jgi:hypothetical protein
MILGGTRSTFGEQNQSIRLTAPSVGFGTAGRTDKVFNEATETLNLGKTSPGAQFSASGFGAQPSSKNTTSPAYHMGARYPGVTAPLFPSFPVFILNMFSKHKPNAQI